MNTLNYSNFNNFNSNGLLEICRYNRNIFMNFNSLSKPDLLNYVKSKIDENNIILIPAFIDNDDKLYKKYKVIISNV